MKTIFLSILSIGLLQANTITMINLGGFGGGSGSAYHLNPGSTIIVGWSKAATGDNHAFVLRPDGVFRDLNGANDTESYAYAVNNAGTVVGTTYTASQAHAIVWAANNSIAVDLGPGSYGLDINASGQVVGGNGQAFLYANGTMKALGNLPTGNWSSAYAINDTGTIAGYANVSDGSFRAFTWKLASGMTALGTLGGNSSYATDINNSGQVVGHSNVATGYEHAFVTSGTSLIDLGTLGGSNSYAYGINNQGAIVGYSWLQGGTVAHAFMYANGQLTDLNNLIPASLGWVLQQAYGIDDAGDIVGSGTLNGVNTAFLMVSNPSAAPSMIPDPGATPTMEAGQTTVVVSHDLRP